VKAATVGSLEVRLTATSACLSTVIFRMTGVRTQPQSRARNGNTAGNCQNPGGAAKREVPALPDAELIAGPPRTVAPQLLSQCYLGHTQWRASDRPFFTSAG